PHQRAAEVFPQPGDLSEIYIEGVKPLRVVLADDHLILRQALKALLEKAGIEIVADEADGVAAVAAVRRHSPDVVVLDVAMPLLNGVDAAREITRSNPHPD